MSLAPVRIPNLFVPLVSVLLFSVHDVSGTCLYTQLVCTPWLQFNTLHSTMSLAPVRIYIYIYIYIYPDCSLSLKTLSVIGTLLSSFCTDCSYPSWQFNTLQCTMSLAPVRIPNLFVPLVSVLLFSVLDVSGTCLYTQLVRTPRCSLIRFSARCFWRRFVYPTCSYHTLQFYAAQCTMPLQGSI